MKNEKIKPDLDEMLDLLKNKSVPAEADFQSKDKFKEEFFRKAEKIPQKRNKLFLKIFLTMSSAAAAVAVALVLNMSTDENRYSAFSERLDQAVAGEAMQENPDSPHLGICGLTILPPSPSVTAAPIAAGERNRTHFKKIKTEAVCGYTYNEMDRTIESDNRISRFNTEEYKGVSEKPFTAVLTSPLSTFGADVDTATYTNLRRMLLQENRMPPAEMIRTEEMLNYFSYDYAVSKENDFHVQFESMPSPWAEDRVLLLAGIQAKKADTKTLPPGNFVFLIDNSGSMYDNMPLVIESMSALAGQLRENDRVSVVTYGGGVNVLMDGISGAENKKIKETVKKLQSGGYTPGSEGIQTAYKLAHKHFIKGGNNRIILITDGDFNVGVSSESELISLVEKERQSAIYLSVFGVGYGNYKDNKLKMIANRGNGNYAYLDNVREAKNVMVNEMSGGMFTLGKDVKFQIEFNPEKVAAYRLIGYEMRALADRDFNDDTKDSGEVGMGHQVTALYELVMADAPADTLKKYTDTVDPLKYRKSDPVSTGSDEILTFKLRYQKPEGKDPSRLLTFVLKNLPEAANNIQWAAAVAEFALILRDSPHKEKADLTTLRQRALKVVGSDPDGKRTEFLTMIRAAEELKK